MTERHSPSHRLRLADLSGRKPTRFDLAPDAAACAGIAAELGLIELPRLSLRGQIAPRGRRDWHLTARLLARVVQPCVATLAPVATDIDEVIERIYLADYHDLPGEEVEMPDDRQEPLPELLDLDEVMLEALALALPPWPRADGIDIEPRAAELPEAEATARRPFAGLDALLRARRERGEDDGPDESGAPG